MVCKDCGKPVEDNSKYCRVCEAKIYERMYKQISPFIDSNEFDATYKRTNNAINKKMFKDYKKANPPTFKKGFIGKLQYYYWINKVLFLSLAFLIVLVISGIVGLFIYNRELDSNQIYDLVQPSVVEISAYSESGFKMAIGSGIIIDKNGEILTNYSIIKGARTLKVTLSDGVYYWATHVVGYHYFLDLAIIKIDVNNLKTLRHSIRTIKPGDLVYTIGSNNRESGYIENGYITKTLKRDTLRCFQMTNPVNQNNYGGALVNKHGELIGINWIAYSDGKTNNYAIDIFELRYVPRNLLTIREFYEKDNYYTIPVYEFYYNELEPNDTLQQAMTISKNGTTIKGAFSGVGDIDYFIHTPSASGIMDVILYPASNYDSTYINLRLLDADGRFLSTGSIRSTRGVRRIQLRYNVVAGETYYIQVGFKNDYISIGTFYDVYMFVK